MGDAGACQTSNKKEYDEEEDESAPPALDEGDIALLKTYGLGPYTTSIKNIEKEITEAKVKSAPPPHVFCVFFVVLVLWVGGWVVSVTAPPPRRLSTTCVPVCPRNRVEVCYIVPLGAEM